MAGLNYRVQSVMVDLSSNLIGETVFEQCQITLRGDMAPDKQQQTFWHEMVHILLEGEETGRSAADERFVTRLSNLLYSVLDDNDLLAKDWWTRVLDEAPNWGSLVVGQPRVAARGRQHKKTCTRRKR